MMSYYFTDEAGKPGTPKAVDWDKDHVDLVWTPPESDGGAKITEWVIEKRPKKSKKWEPCARIPAPPPEVGQQAGKQPPQIKGTAPDLKEREEYEFRVIAVNKAGLGEPSDPSKSIMAKPRFLKPRIVRDRLIPLTVKVGMNFMLEADVIGEPPPDIQWTLKERAVASDQNRALIAQDYYTKLFVKKATRADSGVYRITATNTSGKDEADVEVLVMGKPSMPEGPLEVPDASKTNTSFDVKWQPPKDTGGIPVDYYLIEKQDLKSGKWLPAAKVKGDKLTATVDGLTPKEKYHVRVMAVNKEGQSEALTTDVPIQAKYPFDEPGKPGNPHVADYDKDFVDVAWTPPESDGGSPIQKYVIEKKEKGSQQWKPVAEVPGTKTVGRVTDVTEREECEFRVVAFNQAGAGEPSGSTGMMTVKPKHLKPRIDRRNLRPVTIKAGQSVAYDVDVEGEPPPRKFWLLNGQPVEMTERTVVEFQDYKTKLAVKKASRLESGTYTIVAENDSGRDEAKVEVIVLAKPQAPKGPIVPKEVFADRMKLAWEKPDDDGGLPVQYEVEKFDTAEGRWVPCGKTDKTEIDIDGLEKGHQYKFRVRATNPEGSSDYLLTEQPIEAKNPFDEPGKPSTPELTDWDSEWADLKWEAPEKDGGAPITGYVIEKKDRFGNWEKAAEVKGKDKTGGKVEGLKPGETYQFRVRAVNQAGPGEPSDATEPHVAKPRNKKPRIDRKSLLPIRIKAGQAIAFDVDVEGEPAPTVTWKLGGSELKSDEQTKIDNVDYNTKLTTKQAKRMHSGIYTIVASNRNGTDEAEVEVVVLSAPSRPKGPLKTSDVTKTGCKLEWNPPDVSNIPLVW